MYITDKDGKQVNVGKAGVANTALGLSIGALGVELLRGGLGNVLNGMLGAGPGWNAGYNNYACNGYANGFCGDAYSAHEVGLIQEMWAMRLQEEKELTALNNREAQRFYDLNEKLNTDFFRLYADYNNKLADQEKQISKLNTNFAVLDAVLPYVIKDATCGLVKGELMIPSNDIVWRNRSGCNSCCNNQFYGAFPPVVTSATTTTQG